MIENINSSPITENCIGLDAAKQLLADREQRTYLQEELLRDSDNTLVVIKANYPGATKHNVYSVMAVVSLWLEVKKTFDENIVHSKETHSQEGYVLLVIVNQNPLQVKQRMAALEDTHPMGRLVDIDVMTRSHQYHRDDIHHLPRTCFLCNEVAHVCARSQNHSLHEIVNYYIDKVEAYTKSNIEYALRFALLAEVCASPKFGLVTPYTSGSHSDMDFSLFVRSIAVIAPLIALVMDMDVDAPYEVLFQRLRDHGKEVERAMLAETNNINTHKGAIFLFLLVLLGMRLSKNFEDIGERVRRLCVPLLMDFEKLKGKQSDQISHGEQLYLKHGLLGVRGLATRGMKEVFDDYLPFFTRYQGDSNTRLVATLLHIMETCEDTTLVYRGGLQALVDVQTRARSVMQGTMSKEELDRYCHQHRLSPGGSADLLALVVFLSIIKEGYTW